MKRIILVLALALSLSGLHAQEESPTAKGNRLLNIGVGVFGGTSTPNFMPLHIGMDFFIINNLSLGFDLSWRYYASKIEKDRHMLFPVQAVVDYHFNELMHMNSSWDFYAGLKLGPGYMYTKEEWEDWDTHYESGVKFVFDGVIGFRYYFNEKVGVNSEIGVISVSGTKTTGVNFSAGISVKL